MRLRYAAFCLYFMPAATAVRGACTFIIPPSNVVCIEHYIDIPLPTSILVSNSLYSLGTRPYRTGCITLSYGVAITRSMQALNEEHQLG